VQRSLRAHVTRLSLLMGTAVLLAGCSAHDAEAKLRFGWPTGVTKQAERMRVLWTWSSVAALIVGGITWGLIFWACIAYRKKNDLLPKQMKYHLPIEIAYTIAPFVVIAGLFYYTVIVQNYVNKLTPNPDTTVKVTAFKWNWQFNYNDKKYDSSPAGSETVSTVGSSTEIAILVLPVGKKVRVVEESKDVVHSFWVPEFLFKRDVMPAVRHPNEFEFTATSTGHFVGRCAELCGTYHSQMNFEVRVVEPDKYEAYLNELAKLGPDDTARQSKALAAIGEAPLATETHPFNTDRLARSQSNK